MDSAEPGLLAVIDDQPQFGADAEPPYKRSRPDEEALVSTLTPDGGPLVSLPEAAQDPPPLYESPANPAATSSEAMLSLPAESLPPAENLAPAAQPGEVELHLQTTAAACEPETNAHVELEAVPALTTAAKIDTQVVCPLWPKGGNITCTNPASNPAGLRDKKVILDGREYTLCRSHANKLRYRLRADEGEEEAAKWLRGALISCGVVEAKPPSLTSTTLAQHDVHLATSHTMLADGVGSAPPHVALDGTVIEVSAVQAHGPAADAEVVDAVTGIAPLYEAPPPLPPGDGGALVFPAQKEKASFAPGPRTIFVEGGEGSAAAAMGGRTSVILPPTAGLRELKTIIRKAFGRYPYHKLGRLMLVTNGVATETEVTREHLVEGAVVHCTYTHTTGNQSLPPGGRPKSSDGAPPPETWTSATPAAIEYGGSAAPPAAMEYGDGSAAPPAAMEYGDGSAAPPAAMEYDDGSAAPPAAMEYGDGSAATAAAMEYGDGSAAPPAGMEYGDGSAATAAAMEYGDGSAAPPAAMEYDDGSAAPPAAMEYGDGSAATAAAMEYGDGAVLADEGTVLADEGTVLAADGVEGAEEAEGVPAAMPEEHAPAGGDESMMHEHAAAEVPLGSIVLPEPPAEPAPVLIHSYAPTGGAE